MTYLFAGFLFLGGFCGLFAWQNLGCRYGFCHYAITDFCSIAAHQSQRIVTVGINGERYRLLAPVVGGELLLGNLLVGKNVFHLQSAIAIDLGPNMKSSDLGIHSASMGNVWQCVACGFAGLEWHEGGLSLRSHLPTSWQRAAFNIVWRGAKLHVEVTHAGITVTHRGGSAVEITVDGHPVKLAAE